MASIRFCKHLGIVCSEARDGDCCALLPENPEHRPLKIYLASRYSRRDEMRLYRAVLTLRGYEVTSRWLDETAESMEAGTEADHARVAQVDREDVKRADVLIAFGPGGRHGGLWWEAAIAYENHKLVYIVGEGAPVFAWLPAVTRLPDWEAMLDLFPDNDSSWPDLYYGQLSAKHDSY